MLSTLALSVFSNSSSLASALSPSASALEKLALIPGHLASLALASSREYPPDSANTRRTPGYFSLAKSA